MLNMEWGTGLCEQIHLTLINFVIFYLTLSRSVSVCVCVCVCVYVYVSVCYSIQYNMTISIISSHQYFVCMHACAHAYMHVHMHASEYVWMHAVIMILWAWML